MDREDLDKQLKEHGENMNFVSSDHHKGKVKIAALALALLVIGGAGGCFFGDFKTENKIRVLRLPISFLLRKERSSRSCLL